MGLQVIDLVARLARSNFIHRHPLVIAQFLLLVECTAF